jgi:hypothetical protein
VDEPLLGATGYRIDTAGAAVIVLEPSTEGLLAGWLARNGEGVAVSYVEAGPRDAPAGRREVTALGTPGWLERPARREGLFVIHLDPEGP